MNAASLSATLSRQLDLALLFRTIATLRRDITLFNDVDELQWRGPKPGFEEFAAVLDAAKTVPKAKRTSADKFAAVIVSRFRALVEERNAFQKPANRVLASPNCASSTPIRSMMPRYRLHNLRLSSPDSK